MIIENSEVILSVRDLTENVDGTQILKRLNLEVKAGEIHAIMGPNGSGKSTFSKILAGHPAYEVTGGEVIFLGENLLEKEPEERARSGVFLAFQYRWRFQELATSTFCAWLTTRAANTKV